MCSHLTIYHLFLTSGYLTVKREGTAKKAIWLSGIAITVILSVVAYAGLVIYAHYINCDPIKSGLVSTKDQSGFNSVSGFGGLGIATPESKLIPRLTPSTRSSAV